MTLEALKEGIKRLIVKRQSLPPFSPELDEIGVKLNKLYACYWLMLEQERRA